MAVDTPSLDLLAPEDLEWLTRAGESTQIAYRDVEATLLEAIRNADETSLRAWLAGIGGPVSAREVVSAILAFRAALDILNDERKRSNANAGFYTDDEGFVRRNRPC